MDEVRCTKCSKTFRKVWHARAHIVRIDKGEYDNIYTCCEIVPWARAESDFVVHEGSSALSRTADSDSKSESPLECQEMQIEDTTGAGTGALTTSEDCDMLFESDESHSATSDSDTGSMMSESECDAESESVSSDDCGAAAADQVQAAGRASKADCNSMWSPFPTERDWILFSHCVASSLSATQANDLLKMLSCEAFFGDKSRGPPFRARSFEDLKGYALQVPSVVSRLGHELHLTQKLEHYEWY